MVQLGCQCREQGRCVGLGCISRPECGMHLIDLNLTEIVGIEVVVTLGNRCDWRLWEHIARAHVPQSVLAEGVNGESIGTGVGVNGSG